MATTFGTGNRSIAFAPTSAFPLNANSYFESYEAAFAAANTAAEAGDTNTKYYYGQEIVVVEDSVATLYIIQPDKTLKEVGELSGDNKIILDELRKNTIYKWSFESDIDSGFNYVNNNSIYSIFNNGWSIGDTWKITADIEGQFGDGKTVTFKSGDTIVAISAKDNDEINNWFEVTSGPSRLTIPSLEAFNKYFVVTSNVNPILMLSGNMRLVGDMDSDIISEVFESNSWTIGDMWRLSVDGDSDTLQGLSIGDNEYTFKKGDLLLALKDHPQTAVNPSQLDSNDYFTIIHTDLSEYATTSETLTYLSAYGALIIKGTYNNSIITSDDATLNGRDLDAITVKPGYAFKVTSDVSGWNGLLTAKTGDLLLSIGTNSSAYFNWIVLSNYNDSLSQQIKSNTTSINNIKDGESIDSFKDVEEALKTHTNEFKNLLAANDAMVFKGTVTAEGIVTSSDSEINGNSIDTITVKPGWTFRITNTGKMWGETFVVEPGDMMISLGDNASNPNNWTVIQANTDGHVTGPTSVQKYGNLPVFTNTNGKTIDDSEVNINDIRLKQTYIEISSWEDIENICLAGFTKGDIWKYIGTSSLDVDGAFDLLPGDYLVAKYNWSKNTEIVGGDAANIFINIPCSTQHQTNIQVFGVSGNGSISNDKNELSVTGSDIVSNVQSSQNGVTINLKTNYSNTNITNNIGGYSKGDMIEDATISEVLNNILSPYIAPTIGYIVDTNNDAPGYTLTYENGTEAIPKIDVCINIGSLNSDSYSISLCTETGSPIDTLVENDYNNGNQIFCTLSPQHAISENGYLKAYVRDDNELVYTSDVIRIQFINPLYYGTCNSTPDNPAKMMTKIIDGENNQTVMHVISDPDCLRYCFAYPAEYGLLTSIRDDNGFNVIDDYTLYESIVYNDELYNFYIFNHEIIIGTETTMTYYFE